MGFDERNEVDVIMIYIFDASHRGEQRDENASPHPSTCTASLTVVHVNDPLQLFLLPDLKVIHSRFLFLAVWHSQCGLPAQFCCITELHCHALEDLQSVHHVEMSKIITDGLQLRASKLTANSQQQCENRKGRMSLF